MNDTDELIQYIKDDNRELLYIIPTKTIEYTYYFDRTIVWNKVSDELDDMVDNGTDNATSNCILGMLITDGMLYSRDGINRPDVQCTISYFEKSEKLGCKYASYLLGKLYYTKGVYDKAIIYLNKVIEQGMYGAYIRLINSYISINEYDKAINNIIIYYDTGKAPHDLLYHIKHMGREYIPSYLSKITKKIKN